MKRVLITGGTGFVGANLARRVLRDGHETHLLVRDSHQSWRLDEIARHVRLHEGNLEDGEAIRRIVGEVKPDWVFHLAAYGAYSNQVGFERMLATNLTGCVMLLDASKETGVETFVHTGSSSEYGYKDHPASEDEVLEPDSHYAITKAAATHYCQFVARTTGLNAVTVRLYSIYGPYEEPTRLLPTLILHGLRGQLPPLVSPATARDFVYVDDAVDAMLGVAAAAAIPRGSVFNVCSGSQTTIEFAVETARRLMNIPATPVWSSMSARSWDTDVWVGSPAAMERAIGWRASCNFETGMQKMIDWFRENPKRLDFYSARVFANPVASGRSSTGSPAAL
jgi:nucleoside-diphosphate-sugar epimerase